MCGSVCVFAPCPKIFGPFHDPQTTRHTLLWTQTQPSSFVIALYPSINWFGPQKSIHSLVHEAVSTLQQPQLSTSTAEIRHGCHLFARLCTWMPVRTWFLCPAIVSIDYTGSQRMVQVKATMCRIWEFLTVGRPVEASQDTPAVCLCFQSNLKYAKACSNSTLKWLQSHADLWEMYSVRTSVTDGNKSGHFEYFMLLLAVKVHWNEEKRMAIGSYETEYEIMYFRKFSDSY